jgi:hypothetical protein
MCGFCNLWVCVCVGTSLIKDGMYTFTHFSFSISTEYFKHAAHSQFFFFFLPFIS